jgi:hypothetical protein
VDWLIKWHADRAKTRWNAGTLRQHRDELRQGSLSGRALLTLGLLAATAGLVSGVVGGFEVAPRLEWLLLVVTVAGMLLGYSSRADSHFILRDLYRAETAFAEA